MDELERWRRVGEQCGWSLPPAAAWPFRLPVIRHIRAAWATWMVERHYAAIVEMGLLRTGYDKWVIYAIARGFC